jgi:hypothetical protein
MRLHWLSAFLFYKDFEYNSPLDLSYASLNLA